MQRIEKQSALKAKQAQIDSKRSIIQSAIANKFSKRMIERKENELEVLLIELEQLKRQ